MHIIWFDRPLIWTGLLFIILGYLYGWGLLRYFREDFRWHRASVTGILSVISCLAAFVWLPRYGSTLTREIYFSLFVVFSLALPGMIYVDLELQRDKRAQEEELEELRQKVIGQNEMMRSIEVIIRQEGKRALDEIIKVLELRNEAENMLRKHINNLN